MKKIIFLVFPILLASCFGPSDDEVQKAKDALLNPNVSSGTQISENTSSQEENLVQTQEEKSYYKLSFSGANDFDIEQLWPDDGDVNNPSYFTDKIDITGVVSNKNIDKIKVSFQNRTSSFPVDEYVLKTYKKGDERFLYRAYKEYKVLDFGLNEYTLEGYVGDKISSTVKINVFIADPSKQTRTQVTGSGSEKVSVAFTGDILEHLPTNNETYGAPTANGDDGVFTYSNIADFQGTKNDEIGGVNCENFADYLKQNYTWYYWNTCRPMTDENNFSVNVLSLSGDEYKYERHYVIAKYGIYGKLLLETGTGLMQADLQAKNDELKAKTFDVQTKADSLFKDLLR